MAHVGDTTVTRLVAQNSISQTWDFCSAACVNVLWICCVVLFVVGHEETHKHMTVYRLTAS